MSSDPGRVPKNLSRRRIPSGLPRGLNRTTFSTVRTSLASRLLLAAALPLAAFANDDAGLNLFVEKVEPILKEHCYKCHSHSSDKIKGGLVLDSRDAFLTGGDTGPSIVPGDPEKSLLIEAIRYTNDDLQMPPKGKKLADNQIAALTEWVKKGAPWPEREGQKMATRTKGKITEEDRQWWSFQPLSRVNPPAAEGWGANEVDSFIFARLKAEGLQPAPPAEKSKLLRRV